MARIYTNKKNAEKELRIAQINTDKGIMENEER